jgi:uncharacterized coiled-coil protein SlyX
MGMIVVANTKGGSGKSACAMHLIAPWVYSRTGQAKIIEVDEQNMNSESMKASKIKSERIPLGEDAVSHFAVEKVIEKSYEERIVLDLGGNKTCASFLRHLSQAGAGDDIEMFVVPVSGAGQDVDNAKETLEFIHKEMPDFEGPVLLVLTRSPTVEIEYAEREVPEFFDLLEDTDAVGPIILPQSRLFSGARMLGQSAWEIGENYESLMADIKTAKSKAKKSRNIQQARTIARLNAVIVAGRQWHDHLNQQFDYLDTILSLAEEPAPKESKPGKSSASEASAE